MDLILKESAKVQAGNLQNGAFNELYAKIIIDPDLIGLVLNSEAGAAVNTAILQSIFNRYSDGAEIYLPAGTIWITGNLQIKYDSTHLIGTGKNRTVFKMASNSNTYAFLISQTITNVIKDVCFRDIGFDGNKANQTSGDCLHFNNAYACRVQDCEIVQVKQKGIYCFGDASPKSSLLTVENCNIETCGTLSIHLGLYAQDSVIVDTFTQDCEGTGILVDGFGTKLISCHFFRNGEHGVLLNEYSGRSQVINCTINENQKWGINVSGSKENLICNNLVFENDKENNSQGSIVLAATATPTYSLRNEVYGNLIYDDTLAMPIGIQIESGCSGNQIYGNQITTQITTRYNALDLDNPIIDFYPDGTYLNFLNRNIECVSMSGGTHTVKTGNFIEGKNNGNFCFNDNSSAIAYGAYYDGGWKYAGTGLFAGYIRFDTGGNWYMGSTTASGTEDAAATINEIFTLDNVGNLTVSGTISSSGSIIGDNITVRGATPVINMQDTDAVIDAEFNVGRWDGALVQENWQLKINDGMLDWYARDSNANPYYKFAHICTGFGSSANGCASWGMYALNSATTGNRNVAIGARALENLTSGVGNTALGFQASNSITTEDNNTSIGRNAFQLATGITNGVAIGYNAGVNAISSGQVIIGATALSTGTGGIDSIFIGRGSGVSSTSSNSVFIGGDTGPSSTGTSNTAVGNDALNMLTTGTTNTAVGANCLQSMTTATNNAAIGYLAGNGITGSNSTALGARAGSGPTWTGQYNTAVGAFCNVQAGTYSGQYNISVGYSAGGKISSGGDNIAIGRNALGGGTRNITGDSNIGIGYQAIQFASSGAAKNTAIGYTAATSLTTGTGNIFIGDACCAAGSIATGADNICIGNDMSPGADYSNCIFIGQGLTPSLGASVQYIEIGQSATHTQCFIHGIAGNTIGAGTALYVSTGGEIAPLVSAKRYKKEIDYGLSKETLDNFMKLKPASFRYIKDDTVEQFGLIAEDVEQIDKKLVSYYNGEIQNVNYHIIHNQMIGIVQVLVNTFEDLKKEIDELKKDLF